MSVQFLEARACQRHDLGEPVFGDGVYRRHTVICCSWHLTGRWFFRPPPKAKSVTRIHYRSGTPVRRARIAFLSGFFERGMGGNVGAVTALEYVMGGNFVERYGKKISGSSQKLSCML